MAQLLRISGAVKDFPSTYARRHSLAEGNRASDNRAATVIQSRFRGSRVRAYLRHLHERARVIQKTWRGFSARVRFRRTLKERYVAMKMEIYQQMALRIQRQWRGFCVRKHVHDFYSRKSFFQSLSVHNQLVRGELEEHERLQRRETDLLQKAEEQRAQLCRAHRLHHLLSTKQCPGVFNSPFRSEPHETELLLRRVRYQTCRRRRLRDRSCLSGMVTQMTLSESQGSNRIKHEPRDSCQLKLPPILSRNQQSTAAGPKEGGACDSVDPHLRLSGANLDRTQNQIHRHESGTV
ncbi:spermatogenesis-associated protein 17 [Neosynchiropus ocellatus]